MIYSNKKLLILGGAEIHCKVVRAAKEMGIHTIVTDFLPAEQSPAKEIADESYTVDIFDIEGLIELAKRLKVDGVINTSLDPSQIPHSKVCEALGLPCYGTPQQYFKLTNKIAFKELCNENSIDVIKSYTEEDIYNDAVDYPIFIKPVDSRGSRGQSICYTKEQAILGKEAAKKISTDGTVVIEQFLENKQDFMLTYMVVDSVPYLVRICDRYGGNTADGLEKVGALAMNPSKYTDMYMKNVHHRVVSMIKNLGIKNGPIFLQGFIDGNTVRMYDPGLRLPGGNYENLLKATTGKDIIKMLIELSLTGSISEYNVDLTDAYKLNGHYVSNLFPMMNPGKIQSIIGFEYIKNMPSMVSASLRHNEGDIVEATRTVNQRIGEFNILTKSIHEMKNAIKEVYDNLKILDESGNDLACSKLDIDNLFIGE